MFHTRKIWTPIKQSQSRLARLPWWSLLTAGLILLAFGLRWHDYAQFPVVGETQDEVAWTLLGGSLMQTGTPTSWSWFSAYPNTEIVQWGRTDFRLVTPVVDHPPLFSLIPGTMVTLAGDAWKQLPSMVLVRFPMVFLGTLNVVLFAWWLHRLPISPVWRWTSLAIFATAPSFVFLSRMVLSENLLLTFVLGILLITTRSQTKVVKPTSPWLLWGLLLLHALLPLTKIMGIALAVGSIAGIWLGKSRRQASWAAAGLVIGIMLLFGYMAMFDFGLFWEIQTQQSQRSVGMLTLFSAFLWNDGLVNKPFMDGWLTLGFWSAFAALLVQPWRVSPKKTGNVLASAWVLQSAIFLAGLAFLLLSVGEHTIHGWYRIPFFPLMAFALGWAFNTVWQQRNWWGLAVLWLLMGIHIRLGLVHLLRVDFYSVSGSWQRLWVIGAGVWVLLGLISLPERWQNKLWRMATVLLFAAVLLSHVATVAFITERSYWRDSTFVESGLVTD